ncbi:MAG: hypothetical protein WBD22_09760, partial [Pyrinomonadaceae bacterium]
AKPESTSLRTSVSEKTSPEGTKRTSKVVTTVLTSAVPKGSDDSKADKTTPVNQEKVKKGKS